MSTFKVETVKIDAILPHPNAEKLELAKIYDWQCVVRKGEFKTGDQCIYFPIDSLLPTEIEAAIFGEDSKIKLSGGRIRTIKLRGAISQGLAVPSHLFNLEGCKPGTDHTKSLGITKYEPLVKASGSANRQAAPKKAVNPHFKKYTGIENAKNYPNVFTEDDFVTVSEKIHGSNARAGWVPYCANTFWKKIKSFLRLAPQWEFVYGSHNVQLQDKLLYKGYYKKNIYAEAVVNYGLRSLPKGLVIYGEIYGDGVQKGYTYGCKAGERKLVVFDVMFNGQWLDNSGARAFCALRHLPFVPEIYEGRFNKDLILKLRNGDSVLSPDQKVREGVVVKCVQEQQSFIGRKMLKYISDDYLLKNQDNETLAH